MNDQEKNWGADEWRAPKLEEGDTLLFSEYGRILDRVDYRSHYFRLVKAQGGNVCLLVEHGGGHERIDEYALRKTIVGLTALDSDARYLMLHALYDMYTKGGRKATEKTAQTYRAAFVEGRLKKRKVKTGIKVWINPQMTAVA